VVVRQGGILSLKLLNIYIGSVTKSLVLADLGCHRGAKGAGGIKSNRREGEGQRGCSGDDEGMRCSRESGKAAATDKT